MTPAFISRITTSTKEIVPTFTSRNKWSNDDYLKHADGRPVEGEQHSKSNYFTSLKIQDGTIKYAKRTHSSCLHNKNPHYRPHNKPDFHRQPDFNLKVSGESQLSLLRCSTPTNKRTKRSSEKEQFSWKHLKKDTLTYGEMRQLKWPTVGDGHKPKRTFYELLRCYSDRAREEKRTVTMYQGTSSSRAYK